MESRGSVNCSIPAWCVKAHCKGYHRYRCHETRHGKSIRLYYRTVKSWCIDFIEYTATRMWLYMLCYTRGEAVLCGVRPDPQRSALNGAECSANSDRCRIYVHHMNEYHEVVLEKLAGGSTGEHDISASRGSRERFSGLGNARRVMLRDAPCRCRFTSCI